MNQVGVGLLVGGLVGVVIGLTVAPGAGLPRMDADEQDLLCLEDRTKLMEEVREALGKMEQAGCAPGPKGDALLADLAVVKPQEPVAPQGVQTTEDAGPSAAVDSAAAAVQDAGQAEQNPDAGKPKLRPAANTQKVPVAKPPSALGKGWMVQLIATGDAAEAGKTERLARGLGYTTQIVLEEVADGSRSLYKVRVGPFSDKAGGAEAQRRIKAELSIQGWLHRSR